MNKPTLRNVVVLVVILALAFLAYSFLTMPDQRSASDKVGDAIHDLPQGPGKAARQLEDRTPGQKLGDSIKDNTEAH